MRQDYAIPKLKGTIMEIDEHIDTAIKVAHSLFKLVVDLSEKIPNLIDRGRKRKLRSNLEAIRFSEHRTLRPLDEYLDKGNRRALQRLSHNLDISYDNAFNAAESLKSMSKRLGEESTDHENRLEAVVSEKFGTNGIRILLGYFAKNIEQLNWSDQELHQKVEELVSILHKFNEKVDRLLEELPE